MHAIYYALAYVGKGQRQMVLALINTVFAQESANAVRRTMAFAISCKLSQRVAVPNTVWLITCLAGVARNRRRIA